MANYQILLEDVGEFFADLYQRVWAFLRGEQMDYTLIDTELYQGGVIDELPPGILAVLNLQHEHDDRLLAGSIQAYCWMPIHDAPPFPGVLWLDAAVDFVLSSRRNSWPTLIHCAAGISRSGMVMTACVMKHHHLTRDRALDLIRQKRPQTSPNPAFMIGLIDYQHFLKL